MGKNDGLVSSYMAKSANALYVGYNALQCAAYDGNRGHFQALIDHYREEGNLADQLKFVSPENETHENILHVAMKHTKIFEIACKAIKETQSNSFPELLHAPDCDGDTLLHQAVEFGRPGALEILAHYVDRKELAKALEQQNNHKETPLDIAHEYLQSKTVGDLITRNILDRDHITNAIEQGSKIRELFDGYPAPQSSFGMSS